MTQFIVRIQLPGSPSETTYEILHAAMEKRGFSRTIRSNDGKEYHLPHAEYIIESSRDGAAIREEAFKAACFTRLTPKIFVTVSAGCYWTNLDPVVRRPSTFEFYKAIMQPRHEPVPPAPLSPPQAFFAAPDFYSPFNPLPWLGLK